MTIDMMAEARIGTSTSSPFVLTLLTTPGSAALRIKNSDLPMSIRVDTVANREVARFLAAGVQVYDCEEGKFVPREPQADLYDTDAFAQRIVHFAAETKRPNWADADGSRVVGDGDGIVAVDPPPPFDPAQDIKWLKVPAFQNFGPKGLLGNVTFIQRVLTSGGQAPPSCVGGTISVPYTALYIFWAPK